jgi:Tol biopolymer transport system component
LADFVESPEPHLENIRRIQPGGEAFYEASDISPDGRSLVFTSNYDTKNFWKNQIYSYDLSTGASKRLTVDGYNEHPSYTPDGRHIIFMSNNEVDRLRLLTGTDWWLMDADGGNKQRISFMNSKKHPHSDGHPMWAGLVAWSPDGDWFYGDVQTTLIGLKGKIIKVRLSCECR